MTNHTTISTWRDITGLTDEQIGQLSAANWPDDELLEAARDFVDHNQLQAAMAHIPAPAGAVRTGCWFNDDELTARDVYGNGWNVGDVNARIVGQQDSTGATVWTVEFAAVEGTLGGLTGGQVRELVEVMAEVADELDRLTGDAPPFM